MPISATFDRALINTAATAENLTAAQAKTALQGIGQPALAGLVAYSNDPANRGNTLTQWRAAFPAVFGSLDDATASFVIRVAVAMGGGLAI